MVEVTKLRICDTARGEENKTKRRSENEKSLDFSVNFSLNQSVSSRLEDDGLLGWIPSGSIDF
jgi:hypothetical protein